MWGEDEEKPRDADSKFEKDAPVQVPSLENLWFEFP